MHVRPHRFVSRPAFTLIELAVVMAVLGAIAFSASSMLNTKTVVDNLSDKQEVRQLILACRAARATAVSGGIPVRIESVRNGREILGYSTVAQTIPATILQPTHLFERQLDMSWSQSYIDFLPSGMTDRAMQIVVQGTTSVWTIDIAMASGQSIISQRRL